MARRDMDSATLIAKDKAAEAEQSSGAVPIAQSQPRTQFGDAKSKPPQLPITAKSKKGKINFKGGFK
jgi:hypothetical protein